VLALPSHAPFLVRSASMGMSRAGSIRAFPHGLPRETKSSTYTESKPNGDKVLSGEGIENSKDCDTRIGAKFLLHVVDLMLHSRKIGS
jgi:hypothetical protein